MPENNSKIEVDIAGASFIICLFLSIWLCTGSPDIIDAIVYKLCGKFPQ